MASSSRQVLQPILALPYDRTTVVRDVLAPIFDGHFTAHVAAPIPYELNKADKALLREVRQIASIRLDGGEGEVPILEAHLQPGIRPEHSRVGIQQFIKGHLLPGDAALIAFVSVPNAADGPQPWRLTLVVADAGAPTAAGNATTSFSPARRYTFLLGPGQACRTPAERLETLFKTPDLTRKTLTAAFEVEALSKEFFKEYKRHYTTVCDWILASPMYTSVFKGNRRLAAEHLTNKAAAKHVRDFSKRLLGRIVFLYFVQKKGWLGASSAAYADGDPDFVRNLFRSSGANATFYPVWLSKLFFETLNAPRTQDTFTLPDKKSVKVPFLNGGLFDRAAFEDAASTTALVLPPTLFCATAEADREVPAKRGFLDFLGAYNFTVHEDAPGDHTVAVDPEMLGSIFENLLEDNHEKGAYYTPKEIVHYMCRESLTEYLRTQLPALRPAEGEPDHLANFVQTHELPDALRPHAAELDEKLATVKICDPAIGSGAFPMGLLLEIYQCRLTLTEALGQPLTGEARAALKLAIIQTSIYGVDIEPGAVDIARLRFWLALVVDEETPRALPNLDYKIVVGDSLVSRLAGQPLTLSWGKGSTAREKALLAKYRAYQQAQADYFRASGKAKDQLHAQIDQLKASLLLEQIGLDREKLGGQQAGLFGSAPPSSAAQRKKDLADLEKRIVLQGLEKQLTAQPELSATYFDWSLAFPEVLNPHLAGDGQQVGFDIVVGNPPYVRHELISDQKPALQVTYPENYVGTADLYVYFYERAIRLLRPGGVLAYITPNKFYRAGYAPKLRAYLVQQLYLLHLINFGDAAVFDAIAFPAILVGRKIEQPVPTTHTAYAFIWDRDSTAPLAQFVTVYQRARFALAQHSLTVSGWQLEPEATRQLLAKLRLIGRPLVECDAVKFYRGVLTGFNEAFVIDAQTRTELIAADPASAALIKPYLRGRDVKKWREVDPSLWLITIPSSENQRHVWSEKPAVEGETQFSRFHASLYQHLVPHRAALMARADQGKYYWELRSCAYYAEFEKPKIIWQEIATYQAFAYDCTGFFGNNKVFILPTDDLALLALLNSRLVWWFLNQVATKMVGGALAMQTPYVGQIPVPPMTKLQRAYLQQQAAEILRLREHSYTASVAQLEGNIERMVNELFQLTPEEEKLINPDSSDSVAVYTDSALRVTTEV